MLPSSAAAVLVALFLGLLSQPKILGLGNALAAAAPSSAAPSPSPSPAPSAAPTRPPFNASTMAHLLDIYTGLDGQHWGVPASSSSGSRGSRGWDFSRDAHTRQYTANPCLDRWSFLTCGANNDSVTGLDLTNATVNLSNLGGLPAGLFELTDLTTLVIAHLNDSSRGDAPSTYYTLPSAVGNLRRLETLHISMNKVDYIANCPNGLNWLRGSLPSTLGKLTNLKILKLAANAFNDSVPSSLGRLKALKVLDLSASLLEGTLAKTLSGLSRLEYLDVSHNCKLISSWTPKEMAVLPSLRHLDLSNTNLTGRSIPNAIGAATALTHIGLDFTCIAGTLPTSLGSLKFLQYMRMHSHSLHGSIPSELASLPALEYLNLAGSDSEPALIGPLPSAFGLARSLTRLELSGNQLSGKIPSEIGNLTGMISLGLSNNRLQGEIPSAIGDVKSLNTLSLSSNVFTGPLPDQLYSLTALDFLMLNDNLLSGTISPLIGNMVSLTNLIIKSNRLRGQLPSQLGQCVKLFYMDFSQNAFTGPIPDSLCNITHAAVFIATSNNFTCYPDCLQSNVGASQSYTVFDVDPSVPLCVQAPLASGYLVTSLFSDDHCKELAAETRVMAGQCLRQKHLHYKLKINASELAQGYVTSKYRRYGDEMCTTEAYRKHGTFTDPQLRVNHCYSGQFDALVDGKKIYAHQRSFSIEGPNGARETVYTLSPYLLRGDRSEPVANIKVTEEVLNLLYYSVDPVRSIRVSFVHVNASAYYTTHISSELQGSTSSAAAVASPFVREQGYLVKSAFSQNQTRCLLDLAPSQTAIIPAGTCFNFTDGLPYGNPALLSKLFFCRDGHVKYRVFPTPGCCVGNPDSQCMLIFPVTFAYDSQCAERYESVAAIDEFMNPTHDDDYLLQVKVADDDSDDEDFWHKTLRQPHFLPPAVPPDAAEQKLAGINLTHDHFTGLGVDPSANSSWSCVSPLPAGRPLAGLATVTTFRGPRCVASAIQCELRVALGVCYKGKGASSSSSSSSSSGSYREHYLHPGSWGVLSYDIVKSSFPDTLDCSGRAAPNATTTFLKDTCIADPAKGASYRFEWAGSAAEESYQFQQAERDAAFQTACDVIVNDNATVTVSATARRRAGHSGTCCNVVNGMAASGLALADTTTQAYAVKTLYSDSRCSPSSMVSEEAHLVGDGTCFALSGNRGSYRMYVSRCGAVAGLSSSAEAPDVISLRYSGPGCEEGEAMGYDSSLTGQSACFVSTAWPAGSYTIRVVTGSGSGASGAGGVPPLPRVPEQVSGYVEMVYRSEGECRGRASSLPLLRRAYSLSSCVQRADGGDRARAHSCHSALSFQLDRVSSAVALVSGCGSSRSAPQKTYLAAADINGLPPSTPASLCVPPVDASFYPLVPSAAGTASSGGVSVFATLPAGSTSSVVCLEQTTSVFQQELQDQRNQYALLTFMSVVSLCASLLMLAVIIRMNKYTDAILILLVLTCCQLCYDASFILPFEPADKTRTLATYELTHRSVFLTRFFGLACIMVSDFFAFSVAYIVFLRKSFPTRRLLPSVCAAIFAVSLIITACLTAATPRYEEIESASKRALYADSLLALRGFQIACILFNLIAFTAVFARTLSRRWREQERSTGGADDALLELCKRLAFYPLLQALTQFPVMWDTFAYQLDAQGHFPKSDDDFYSSKPYRAYGYVNALLVPSSGLLFAIVFFAFQPGASEALGSSLRGLMSIAKGQWDAKSKHAASIKATKAEVVKSPLTVGARASKTEDEDEAQRAESVQASRRASRLQSVPVSRLDDDELGELISAQGTLKSGEGVGATAGAGAAESDAKARQAATGESGGIVVDEDAGLELILLEQGYVKPSSLDAVLSAVHAGDEEALAAALAAGANASTKDAYGQSAVYLVARHGQLGCLRLLVSHGADLSEFSSTALAVAKSPAHAALHSGHLACLEFLYSQGVAEVEGVTMLHVLAALGRLQAMRELKDATGLPNSELDAQDHWDQRTPLHWACESGQHECLQFLVSAGADVNARDKGGCSVAHIAAKRCDDECLKTLSEADLAARDNDGNSVVYLALAAKIDNVKCLKTLWNFDHNLVLNEETRGDSAALTALMQSQWSCFLFLDSVGATLGNVDKCDVEGKSACHLAAVANTKDSLRVLDVLIQKYDAVYLSKRAGLLSPEDKLLRVAIFGVVAIILAIGIGFHMFLHPDLACIRFFPYDDPRGVVLTPYTVLFAYTFLFKMVQYNFEEVLTPAVSFLRFYRKNVAELKPADQLSAPQTPPSLASSSSASSITEVDGSKLPAARRPSQFALGSVYAQEHDVIPESVESNCNPLRTSSPGISHTSRLTLSHATEGNGGGVGSVEREPPLSQQNQQTDGDGPSDGDGERPSHGHSPNQNPNPNSSSRRDEVTSTHDTWHGYLVSLFHPRALAFLTAPLDQTVVKEWRRQKYLSSSKSDPEYTGDDAGRQTAYLFLYLQIGCALVALLVAAVSTAASPSPSWAQSYQNFYGLVVNSGVATAAFSVIKMHWDGRTAQLRGFSLPVRCFVHLPLAVLLPPVLTHVVPGAVLYCWLLLPAVLITRAAVLAARTRSAGSSAASDSRSRSEERSRPTSRALVSVSESAPPPPLALVQCDDLDSEPDSAIYELLVSGALSRHSELEPAGDNAVSFLSWLQAYVRARTSASLRAYLAAFLAELSSRFLFLLLVLTCYTYASLFYNADGSANMYMGAISTDIQLRSQTFCFAHHSLETARGMLLLLSFL